jgi:hypothetical protein
LLPDPEVGTPARSLLALIGVPEDLRLAVQLAPPPSRKLEANYWAYALSSALLQPDCDEEWDFLRRCALGDYRVSPRPPDTTVEASTIQTLALIDTPRSRAILEEVRHKNSHRAASIARMIQTIQSHPSPLAGPDPKELARRLGRTLEMGDFERAEKPWYNETGDKVLISIFHRRRRLADADLHFPQGRRGLAPSRSPSYDGSHRLPLPSMRIRTVAHPNYRRQKSAVL